MRTPSPTVLTAQIHEAFNGEVPRYPGPEAVLARHQLDEAEPAITTSRGSQPLLPHQDHRDPLEATPSRQHHPPVKAGRRRERQDMPQVHDSRASGIGKHLLELGIANPLLGDRAVTAKVGPVNIGQLPGAEHFVPSVPFAGAALPGAPCPQAETVWLPLPPRTKLGPRR